jgi:hypothetical protein
VSSHPGNGGLIHSALIQTDSKPGFNMAEVFLLLDFWTRRFFFSKASYNLIDYF